MSWTDLNVDDVAEVSYPARDRTLLVRREPGPPKIIVQALPAKAHKVVFLRVPDEFLERLNRTILGSKSAAIYALMEEALTELEQGQERWRVITRDSV